MPERKNEEGPEKGEKLSPKERNKEVFKRIETMDFAAYPAMSQAIGAMLDLIEPTTAKDMARLFELQEVRLKFIEMEALKHEAARQAEIDRQKAAEEARDKYGGRGENPRLRAEPPQDPEGAMRFLATLLPFVEGPIHQLADDAERATHLHARVSAGASTARLMQAAASLCVAIHRIGGESRHRMVNESRQKPGRDAFFDEHTRT